MCWIILLNNIFLAFLLIYPINILQWVYIFSSLYYNWTFSFLYVQIECRILFAELSIAFISSIRFFYIKSIYVRFILKSTILLIRSNIHCKMRSLEMNVRIFRYLFFVCRAIALRRRIIIIILIHGTITITCHCVFSCIASSCRDSITSCSTVFTFYTTWMYIMI